MKKVIIIFVLTIIIISGVAFWALNTDGKFDWVQAVQFGIIAILILFALVFAFSRIGSLKKGLPAEDEFSKELLKIAAARSYYFSLYLWLGIMYFNSEGTFNQESLFGIGIMGMAVLFGIHWIILKFTGIKDE